MLYKETTAVEAVKHFAKHIFPTLFVGQRNKDNKEYHRVFRIVQAAERGKVSETRARDVLWKYGGLSYRITNCFEVAIQNPCIYCGSECREVNVFSEEFRGQTLTYAKYVCTADPNHFWQSGKQMDETRANGPAFKEALEKIWAEGGEEIETKI